MSNANDSQFQGTAQYGGSGKGEALVEVRNLTKHYPITRGLLKREVGRVKAVDGIDFTVHRGETLGLVGESGCGKSTAATTMLSLEDPTGGEVIFDGENIFDYDKEQMRQFRRRAQMIFQDPTSSFDPRMSIGQSVAEPLVLHGIDDKADRREIVGNLLERVGLEASDYGRYPHEFSGGQKQRIALARAMVVNPELIVADEPTSALDVSIQSEILSLIEEMQEDFGLSFIFISHDLGVIREICDRVAVMYLGEIVEMAPTEKLFEDPQHPYTKALLRSIPRPDPHARGERAQLTGDVPNPANPPSGCRFHTRCPDVIQPRDVDIDQSHYRRVMDMRERLAKGQLDADGMREVAVAETDFDEPEAVDRETLEATLRDEFDLPDSLTDPRAEQVLSESIDKVLDEDPAGASESLGELFRSPCETTKPETVRIGPGHEAACHLIEDTVPER